MSSVPFVEGASLCLSLFSTLRQHSKLVRTKSGLLIAGREVCLAFGVGEHGDKGFSRHSWRRRRGDTLWKREEGRHG